MTAPTDAGRARAAGLALLREQVVEPMTWGETLDGGRLGIAAADALLDRYVAAERAAAVADLRARVEAVAEEWEREDDWNEIAPSSAAARLRAAVADDRTDPA